MPKPKRTKWNWKCVHCKHRNLEAFDFNMDLPYVITADWECSSCGSMNYIKILSYVFPDEAWRDSYNWKNRLKGINYDY